MRLIIVTGLSGSGRTTAARVLEDEGFYVIDNFPLALVPQFLQLNREKPLAQSAGIALVMDVRTPHFSGEGKACIETVKAAGYEPDILFLESADDILIRRFSETRRRHPLLNSEGLVESIAAERLMLAEMRNMATAIIDTSSLSVHELKASVLRHLYTDASAGASMGIRLLSFGFRYGLPVGADLVIDVRFLPNPHYIEALRPQCGLDPDVARYVLDKPVATEFLQRTAAWLLFMLPLYKAEGKSYLTIAIGCTGGKHRSVAIAEELHAGLVADAYNVRVSHRDLVRER
ncbi:MAG: RNase adapter RapZ [Desulfuromonadaceae bacterium]|nr:RNase adapter RapZ [Desulfuromonadaceae bacterium]